VAVSATGLIILLMVFITRKNTLLINGVLSGLTIDTAGVHLGSSLKREILI
jgi:hypothetical protein|tara:strand:+ start:5420 stop:5572 length:153 start_codon:yes stop_codon:yes gene_type:complete